MSAHYVWHGPSQPGHRATVVRLMDRDRWLLLTDEARQARADLLRQIVDHLGEIHARRYTVAGTWPRCARQGCSRYARAARLCPSHYEALRLTRRAAA